ncbi:MAG: error-prone DNA polymerase [Acidobacteria bacterium]|nr:error-prone DNA polymerase [Acidobacteriota bacterium]
MYTELHASSAFSFLEAASLPETLVERAAALGYSALALIDRDGVYGAPRFHKAARAAGIKPIIGCESTMTAATRKPQAEAVRPPNPRSLTPLAPPKPDDARRAESGEGGWCLPVLVETREGYQHLCRLITRMKLRSPKGEGALTLDDLDGHTGGLVAIVGREALAAGRHGVGGLVDRITGLFGRANVAVELQRHFLRDEETANQMLRGLASAFHVPLIVSNGVRFADPVERPLYDVLTCIRHKTTIEQAGRKLARNAERYLKPPAEMAALFGDAPAALAATCALADRLQYSMADLGYHFPDFPVPAGETASSFLRAITLVGARERYRPFDDKARAQVNRELDLIEKLDLAGYFLIVWDIVNFCREQQILVQGRGSAANSAVCYSLGITAVDPVGMDLLFERFLSEERGEWPDIDLDLPSGDRRERVIQHVYEKYGRHGAAMTANVITYRDRSATREVGKVLGFEPAQLDRLSKLLGRFEFSETDEHAALLRDLRAAGLDPAQPKIALFVDLWRRIQDLPRHLGQHSGGMVIARGRLDDVVPLENASMPGRVVVQWDKDDCADMGIVKIDLLGLGMMAALQDAFGIINQPSPVPPSPSAESNSFPTSLVELRRGLAVALRAEADGVAGQRLEMWNIPPDDRGVYEMLQRADTVGVFQVESRAQMATLPRLKPAKFYDLVVEVALIRPGPIVGQMVHPYLDRRAGRADVVYPHPSLEPILARTLGVPLFQQQLLRIAMVAAGFTAGQAEELRRAMGFKRSEKRMKAIEGQLRAGMARQGITGEAADGIVKSIASFALYGFPESHAASFALIVYASAYLKAHFPAAFYAALLNNQPMGFYHPATLVKDAQRHGVRFAPVDVQHSRWECEVEEDGTIRIGLRYVAGLRRHVGEAIEGAMVPPPSVRFRSLEDCVRRTGANKEELAVLAEIGALNAFGYHRREALWQIEKAVRPAGELYEEDLEQGASDVGARFIAPEQKQEAGSTEQEDGPCPLLPMSLTERLVADYGGTRLTIGPHPMALRRRELAVRGVLRAVDLPRERQGRRIRVAGTVITRQRPGTAKGFVFLTLEDETGISNIIVRPDLFARDRLAILEEPFLLIEGWLQNQEGVTSVRAERVEGIAGVPIDVDSHDFY